MKDYTMINVFSFDYNTIDANNILDIFKYLMKIIMQNNLMLQFIKKMFIRLLSACTMGCFGESLASNSDWCI